MTATSLANLRKATPDAIAEAAALLARSALVAFPTETVYGLGANARDDLAVAAIFAAKKRPRFNPLIVHVRNARAAEEIAEFSPLARRLCEAFWPGPLTLVLPRRKGANVSLLVSAGLDTVALRVPANPVAQALLEVSALPLAAPSANTSGSVSATTATHVAESLGESVDLILDGGPTTVGIESTIVGFQSGRPELLRAGAITRDAIEAVAGPLVAAARTAISAPGQLESHYAPRAPLRLDAHEVRSDEALLAFGPHPLQGAKVMLNLSQSGDLKEAAANLFAMLRALDAGATAIAAMRVPQTGLGEAINDRLRRAAAPRGGE
jgi:L-threonylcarbamoyladenylate synthase